MRCGNTMCRVAWRGYLEDVAEALQVGHPLDHPAFLREGDDGKGADVEVPPPAARVLGEQAVQHPRELHHARVLAQVVLGLAQKRVLHPVAAHQHHLRWQALDFVGVFSGDVR